MTDTAIPQSLSIEARIDRLEGFLGDFAFMFNKQCEHIKAIEESILKLTELGSIAADTLVTHKRQLDRLSPITHPLKPGTKH